LVNALVSVVVDVVGDEVLHVGVAHHLFHIGEQLEAFFVGNFGERIIRVIALKNWVAARVGVGPAKVVDRINQRSVSNKGLGISKILVEKFGANLTFNKGGEAFVEPEVLPVVHRDGVAGP
jgi:hypothetical protein